MGDERHSGDLEPIGVVDIGSNSVRLVVYEGAIRAPTPIFNEKVLCGLGRSIASTGSLGAVSVERALEACRRFRAIAGRLGVKTLLPFATAAVRDATNGPDFKAHAEEILGSPIEILTGEREAQLAANGIIMGFDEADGIAGDLGGGSLELVDIAGRRRTRAMTLPLGGLRLLDTTSGKMPEALKLVEAQLDTVPWLVNSSGRRPFYAVGGTWRAIAKLHMANAKYPLRVMQGYSVPTEEMIAYCEMLRKKKLHTIPGIRKIAKARSEVLPLGALVLERLLLRMKPSRLVISVHGVREGLLFGMLQKHEQKADPLLSFCARSAELQSRSAMHAHELCSWTDQLFVEQGPSETAEQRRLRHAACLLSDIGWRAHPDYRGEQSLSMVAHSALSGIDHKGRVFLALVIYYRHTGPGFSNPSDLPARLIDMLDKEDLQRARLIAAAIRTAHMLSIGRPGTIDEIPITYEDGLLVLHLPPTHAPLDGERLRNRAAALARQLGLDADVRLG